MSLATCAMKRVRFARATRFADGVQRGWSTSDRILFGLVGREPAAGVVPDGGRMIERARVQPDALRCEAPGGVDGVSQQVRAQAPADELVEQTEVGDFHAALFVGLQLEIAGWCAANQQQPDRHGGLSKVR